LGVREQTYVLLFDTLAIPEATSVAMSLLNYALSNLVVGLIGGVVYAVVNARELTFHG
jgi:uncharacterized membrane protein YbhN (UPF0104 family)